MQDFDTLRNRVEETAQKLTSAQGERQDQTETLVGILRQLEEKYAAQEQQVAFYRDRVEPLEQANGQLSLLMGNLLDLIDNGFGEDSLAPMREASQMASAMLATDMAMDMAPTDESAAEEAAPTAEIDHEPLVAEDVVAEEVVEEDVVVDAATEPEAEAELEIAAESEAETESELIIESEPDGGSDAEPAGLTSEDVLELLDVEPEEVEPSAETVSDEADAPEVHSDGTDYVVTDFEMEEEALVKLEGAIDPAAEEVAAPVEMVDDTDVVATQTLDQTSDQALHETAQDDAITIDEIVNESDMTEMAEAVSDQDVSFEDVSAATLEFELDEDATAGIDDLPEIVQIAAAAAQSSDTALGAVAEDPADQELELADAVAEEMEIETTAEADVPEIAMEDGNDGDTAADEAEAIAAIAKAIEEESNAENAAPPAPADIRSLLLRVEALAKKADSMRMAQGLPADAEPVAEGEAPSEEAESTAEDNPKQAGAAA